MTTNNIDVLDPALIRPGRADIIQEFGFINPDKINQFAQQFIGDTKPLPLLLEPAIPAEIVGILKANIHSKDKGYKALSNWVKERNEKVYVEEE